MAADFARCARVGVIVVVLLLIDPGIDSGSGGGRAAGPEDVLSIRTFGMRQSASCRVRSVGGPVGGVRLEVVAPLQVGNAGSHCLPRSVVRAQVLIRLALAGGHFRHSRHPNRERHQIYGLHLGLHLSRDDVRTSWDDRSSR